MDETQDNGDSTGGAPLSPLIENLSPSVLADLMLACPLRRLANPISLHPDHGAHVLLVKRGSLTLANVRVPSSVGDAAVARLSMIADLDPLAPRDALSAGGQVARVRIRAGHDRGDVLVSVGVTSAGLEAEIQPLVINGRPFEPKQGQLKRCLRCAAYQSPQSEECEFDQSALIDVADDPRHGGTIGAYRLGPRLGDGGTGEVFAAQHALIGRAAAIKVLHPKLAENPPLVRRFLSEARAASRIHHPNVVDVTDFGLLTDGRPYMVMERLEGESLQDRLDRDGALDPVLALQITWELGLALGAAHACGIVHHDLKPENVILLGGHQGSLPRLKLVDFGAASLDGSTGDLDSGYVQGTPWYMAPEHARGGPTDGRADLYSLGVVLYQLLSGEVPFDADQFRDILMAHATRPPPPLKSPRSSLPQAVTGFVDRLLRKSPNERFQNAREMMPALRSAIEAMHKRTWLSWLP